MGLKKMRTSVCREPVAPSTRTDPPPHALRERDLVDMTCGDKLTLA